MRNWYTIKALAATGEAEISIYDEIGSWGVTAAAFIADLKKIDAKKIVLSINSPGGSVFDGYAIYNALKFSGKEITVRVMGIAASMASYIAMAGTKIEMPANSMMMVHNAISGVYGDAENMRDVADVLDKIDNSIVATYMARTGKSEEDVRALMAADTFMTAAEALELGFATDVIDTISATANFELDKLPENVRAMFKASAAKPGPDDEEDKDDAEDTDDEPPEAFADQVSALATEAKMPEFAAHWAMTKTTVADVKAVIAEAREIKALCAVAKSDDQAAKFIKGGTPLAKVREELCALLAAKDAASHTDTTKRNSSTPHNPAQPVAIKTADIWAARNKQSSTK